MEVRELCIGNYVLNSNKEIHTIEKLDKLSITSTSIISNSTSIYSYPDMPMPILLTDEWLEDLGFEKTVHESENSNSDYYWTGGLNLFVYKDDNTIFLGALNDEGCEPLLDVSALKYLHELQNLYFFLKGNELTKRPEVKVKWEKFMNELKVAKINDTVIFEFDDRIAETFVNNELTKKCEELNCKVYTSRNSYSLTATFKHS